MDYAGAILVSGHHTGISNTHRTKILRKYVQIFPEIPEIAYMEHKFSTHSGLETGETQAETIFFFVFQNCND
jgi:hypothetical protein